MLTALWGSALVTGLGLLATLSTSVVYGLGGELVIHGALQLGAMVALATLLTRLYGPITSLSNVQVNVMTALVSFDRVFEVLDLKPLIAERPGATVLAPAAWTAVPRRSDWTATARPNRVRPRELPVPGRVRGLAGLAGVDRAAGGRAGRAWPAGADRRQLPRPGGQADGAGRAVRRGQDHDHPPGVAGCTTRSSGAVRIGGADIRDVTLESLHDVVGVVTQDAHLYHDTIRANLLYARPAASEHELVLACQAAQIWDLVSALPDGLDTVVGDRGYRLSGGEKQRIALARLLLKAPSVVVLDEATAHLDSESEAAVQRALKTALAGRTSLVIAHRLSTIREADQILVIDERPGHRARAARRPARGGRPVRRPVPDAVRPPGDRDAARPGWPGRSRQV